MFVTGTNTGVGKTEVSCFLLRTAIQLGLKSVAIKPVETGLDELRKNNIESDFQKLNKASNGSAFCTYEFKVAASPWQAAGQEGKTIDKNHLIEEIHQKSKGVDFILVEGAGGWHVPLTEDYWISDLAKELNWPVLLVAAMELGSINHVLLSEDSILKNVKKSAVVMNEINVESKDIASQAQIKKLIKSEAWAYRRGVPNKNFWNAFRVWAT